MLLNIIATVCIILNSANMLTAGPLQSWTFDLLELTGDTSNRDMLDLKYEVVRLGRGLYGFSGFVHLKVDFYDDVKVTATVERSKYRSGPYSKFPMGVDNETLSNIMNKYYKYLLQPQAIKCCDNAPAFKKKFVEPLTKRYVKINNCSMANDNLPNIIMEGYYRFRLIFAGPIDVFVEALSLVEAKTFLICVLCNILHDFAIVL